LECYHRAGVHVADIGGDPWRVDDIVEVQHGHERVHLHEHRQRLADPARRAEDRDLEPRRAALGAARRGPQRRRALLHLQSHAQRHSSRFNSDQIRSPRAGGMDRATVAGGARTCGRGGLRCAATRAMRREGELASGCMAGSRSVGRCRGWWLARGTGG
jgi:hypothetical protein